MKYFITGGQGQLGYDLIKELQKEENANIYAPSIEELDITNQQLVEDVITLYNPDYIFHCAAYTAVDAAEDNPELCNKVNIEGTKYIAQAAKKVNAKIIYISTDYVFDGTKKEPYETEDECNPINVYGNSKYQGEKEIVRNANDFLITRISWVFGINGNNFIKTMLRLVKEGKTEINIVSDQIGSPTYTVDLAKALVELKDEMGIYHITNEDYCSWAELAKYVFDINGINVEINPVLTQDYKTKALRPLNSRLSKEKLKNKLPHWKDAVARFCEELKGE